MHSSQDGYYSTCLQLLCLRRYSCFTIRKWMSHFFTKPRFFNAYLLMLFPLSVQCVYICLRTCTVNISVTSGSSTTIKREKLRAAKCAKNSAKVHKSHDMDFLISSRIKIWTRFPRNKTVKKRKSRNIRDVCWLFYTQYAASTASLQQQLEQLRALYQNDQLPVGYDFHSNKISISYTRQNC